MPRRNRKKERYERATERNVHNFLTTSKNPNKGRLKEVRKEYRSLPSDKRARCLQQLKHILGIRKSDDTFDKKLKEALQ